MISPFEVYLVMQLDSIGVIFALAFCALGLVVLVASIMCVFAVMDDDEDALATSKALFRKMITPFIFVAVIGSLIPSSKTAAAMIILPALTSKEVTEPLAKEGKELYALAKQALRDAVDAKDETKEPPQ